MNPDIETLRAFIGASEQSAKARNALERVEKELERLSNRLEWEKRCHRVATEKLVPAESERDAIRAKLARAREAITNRAHELDKKECCGHGVNCGDHEECCGDPLYMISSDEVCCILAELSDDAPAQQKPFDKWTEDETLVELEKLTPVPPSYEELRVALAKMKAERDALRAKLDKARDGLIIIAAGGLSKSSLESQARVTLSELCTDAPAQPPQISVEAVERACVEAGISVTPFNMQQMRAAIAAALEVMGK